MHNVSRPEVKSLTHVKRTSPALRILAGPQNRDIRPTGDPITQYRCRRQGGQLSEVFSKETLASSQKFKTTPAFFEITQNYCLVALQTS